MSPKKEPKCPVDLFKEKRNKYRQNLGKHNRFGYKDNYLVRNSKILFYNIKKI